MIGQYPMWRMRVLGVVLMAALLSGCQHQEASNERQARLLAARNVELEGRLADRQAQIAALKQGCAEKLQAGERDLAQCKARNEALQEDLQEGIAERVNNVTAAVMNENARLRGENTSLKGEIERLKAEIERLKPPTGVDRLENP